MIVDRKDIIEANLLAKWGAEQGADDERTLPAHLVRDFNALHEANQGEVPPWLNPDGLIPTPTVDLPQTLAFPAGDSTFERSGQESWFLTEDVYENK